MQNVIEKFEKIENPNKNKITNGITLGSQKKSKKYQVWDKLCSTLVITF